MNYNELENAVLNGVDADPSQTLANVLREIEVDLFCPESDGWEGRETFPNCGECIYCLTLELRANKII